MVWYIKCLDITLQYQTIHTNTYYVFAGRDCEPTSYQDMVWYIPFYGTGRDNEAIPVQSNMFLLHHQGAKARETTTRTKMAEKSTQFPRRFLGRVRRRAHIRRRREGVPFRAVRAEPYKSAKRVEATTAQFFDENLLLGPASNAHFGSVQVGRSRRGREATFGIRQNSVAFATHIIQINIIQ